MKRLPTTTGAWRRAHPDDDAMGLDDLPAWAQMAHADLRDCASAVCAGTMDDEMLLAYLGLSGPEERCWPARAYWREMVAYMGAARRRRLAMARLWPEFVRFRQGRRSPRCTEFRRLWLAGGRPRGLDCVHAAHCDHCRQFGLNLLA